MEAILAFVQELLTHLKEFDAAAIIKLSKTSLQVLHKLNHLPRFFRGIC